jgi:excinuclease ABC subunit B
MGRAARHVDGSVIMYADHITNSMEKAISEVNRRRKIQTKYNRDHHLTPLSITKPIRERIVEKTVDEPVKLDPKQILSGHALDASAVDPDLVSQLTPHDTSKLIGLITRQMNAAARQLDFELAAKLRDKIIEIKNISS